MRRRQSRRSRKGSSLSIEGRPEPASRPRAARARARGGSLSGAGRSAKTYVGASTGRSAVRSRRSALPTRAGGSGARATRGPKMPSLATKTVANASRKQTVESGGDRAPLASKAIGLGGPGGESHVLCVTLRTGATAENADIGRRLRGRRAPAGHARVGEAR